MPGEQTLSLLVTGDPFPRPHAVKGDPLMDGPGIEPDKESNFDIPFWDLYTRGTVIMIAYHRCGPEREPIIARYHILSQEYECPRSGALHAAVLDISDRPV